jgi:hypothetical protein
MMEKITQQDLLTEGFWDKFNPKPAIKQGWEAMKQVSSVVAPEIHDPIKKTWDKAHDMKKNIKKAGKSVNDIVVSDLIQHGYYPYDPKNGIRWAKKKNGGLKTNDDGTLTGIIKVGSLGYDDQGQPKIETEFDNELKRDLTFTYDKRTRDVKVVNHPHKNLTVTQSGSNPPKSP